MPIQGDVKNLYSDREKTRALFPTTKVSAVSDDNGVGLGAILEDTVHTGPVVDETATAPINADTLGGRPAEEFATQNYVATEIAKAQLGGGSGEADLSGFATKDDVTNAVNNIDYPVDSVNGKTGIVVLNAVDVGAHPNTWFPTIAEIGAAPAGYGYGETLISINGTYSEVTAALDGILSTMKSGETKQLGVGISGQIYQNAAILYKYSSSHAGLTTLSEVIHESPLVAGSWRMVKNSNVWREIEWINPPMDLGVEYRTIERFSGFAVYTKLVHLGSFTGTQTIPIGNGYKQYLRANGIVRYNEGRYLEKLADGAIVDYQKNGMHYLQVNVGSTTTVDGYLQMWYYG